MDIKPLLGTAVGIGAVGLVLNTAKNTGLMSKPKKPFKSFKMKAPRRKPNLIKAGGQLLVGTALLGATAGIINDIK